MAERTFFSLRYALPGYTFILIIILVAFPSLQTQIFQGENIEFGVAFLAFLSLLSGGALGFLVSQIWHVMFNWRLIGNYGSLTKTKDFVKKEFKEFKITNDDKKLVFFIDYLARLGSSPMKDYTQRRYDLMHVCGSTVTTLLIGAIFGFLIRVNVFQLDTSLIDVSGFSFPYDVIVTIIIVILVLLLLKGLKHAMHEHSMGFDQTVREVISQKDFSKKRVIKAFSEDWFELKGSNSIKKKE